MARPLCWIFLFSGIVVLISIVLLVIGLHVNPSNVTATDEITGVFSPLDAYVPFETDAPQLDIQGIQKLLNSGIPSFEQYLVDPQYHALGDFQDTKLEKCVESFAEQFNFDKFRIYGGGYDGAYGLGLNTYSIESIGIDDPLRDTKPLFKFLENGEPIDDENVPELIKDFANNRWTFYVDNYNQDGVTDATFFENSNEYKHNQSLLSRDLTTNDEVRQYNLKEYEQRFAEEFNQAYKQTEHFENMRDYRDLETSNGLQNKVVANDNDKAMLNSIKNAKEYHEYHQIQANKNVYKACGGVMAGMGGLGLLVSALAEQKKDPRIEPNTTPEIKSGTEKQMTRRLLEL